MSSTRFRSAALIAVAVASIWLAGLAVSEEKRKTPLGPSTDRLTDSNFATIFEALQPPRVEQCVRFRPERQAVVSTPRGRNLPEVRSRPGGSNQGLSTRQGGCPERAHRRRPGRPFLSRSRRRGGRSCDRADGQRRERLARAGKVGTRQPV